MCMKNEVFFFVGKGVGTVVPASLLKSCTAVDYDGLSSHP